MSENPELDPYRPPRTLEPDASSVRPPAWSVALRRMTAFLDSPRRAMRDVLDHASVFSVVPLAAAWGINNTLSRGWRAALSTESPGEFAAAIAALMFVGAVLGNVALLWFASFGWLTAWMFSIPVRFRDVLRVYGWAAVPQVVTLVLLVAYLLLSFTSILQPTDSSRFTHTLAGGLLVLLGVVMGLLQLSICVTGLSEASGKTVGRSAWWLVVSVVLGFGCALLLVQASFLLLFG